MRVMHKYQLPTMEEFTLLLPRGSVIRHVESQERWHYMWVESELRVPKDDRIFRVFATGEDIPDIRQKEMISFWRWEWRATWTDRGFVWHLFEKVGGV